MIELLLVKPFGSIWNLKRLCQRTRLPILKRLYASIYNLYQHNNGSSIALESVFKGEPCLPHGTKGIFISGGAEIGKNCVIFPQVVVGSNALSDSETAGAPRIGDNCYIGAGAKIVGKVRVGENVRVGANAVVYRDVPDNSVVTSGEQTITTRDTPLDNRFYSYIGKWVYFDDGKWKPVTDIEVLKKLGEI
ncbi:MAG: serine acetyltransferase [Dehalococcoidia bacterium]|nr:serine acetyltransferase [Dehalococcoidia bacterium]MDZ4245765.1 serine acetyltransferase [Dehalococcoidia bacterium]